MPLIENSDSVAAMIRDALTRFATTHPGLSAERAVVWFEPEHEHCGLYISTDAETPKLLPTEFDFQNFAVTDVVLRCDYEEQQEEFWREAEELLQHISRALPSTINPRLWALQVGFEHFHEWEVFDDCQGPKA